MLFSEFLWLVISFGLWFYQNLWLLFHGEEQLAKYINKFRTYFHDYYVWIPEWILYQQLHTCSHLSIVMDIIELVIHLPEFHPLFEGFGCFVLFFFSEQGHLISPHGCKHFNISKEHKIVYCFTQYDNWKPVQNPKQTKL